jgi:hypothetical protein
VWCVGGKGGTKKKCFRGVKIDYERLIFFFKKKTGEYIEAWKSHFSFAPGCIYCFVDLVSFPLTCLMVSYISGTLCYEPK